METRPLTPKDLNQFRALWIDGLTRFPLSFLFDVADVESLPNERLADMLGNGHLVGLFDGAVLIGFAGVDHRAAPRTRHRATLGPFYVLPEWHGTGAADQLMVGCLDMATGKGAWLIALYVAADNSRAIRFYERHGFIHEGRMPAAIVVDGKPYDDFYYCLELPH